MSILATLAVDSVATLQTQEDGTLGAIALECAVKLGLASADRSAILDLADEIKTEIRNAIRHYNRRPWSFTETRDLEFLTIAGQTWYSFASDGTSTFQFADLLNVDYIREEASSLDQGLCEKPYKAFKQIQEGSTAGGPPIFYARYGDELGLYPTPDQTYTINLSGQFKAAVPTADSDTSVWFTEIPELIVASACGRVCLVHRRDRERAMDFAAIAKPLEDELHAEWVRKARTGRVTPYG